MDTLIIIFILVVIFHIVYPLIFYFGILSNDQFELVSNASEIINESFTTIISIVSLIILCKNLKVIQEQNIKIAKQIELSRLSTEINALEAYNNNSTNESTFDKHKHNIARSIRNKLTEDLMKSDSYSIFDRPELMYLLHNKFEKTITFMLTVAPINLEIFQEPKYGDIEYYGNKDVIDVGENIIVSVPDCNIEDLYYKVTFAIVFESAFSKNKWIQKFEYYPNAIKTEKTDVVNTYKPELLKS